jgi:uracil-DNA glycosylase
MTATDNLLAPHRELRLADSWKQHLLGEFAADYMASLRQFLLQEKARGKHIFPAGKQIGRAHV